jgi:protein O-GlcNAc transferase
MIVLLPDCYLPNDSARCNDPDTPKRADAGLPATGFVFSCLNSSYKFSPGTYAIWKGLLKAVNGSVLWLTESNPAAVRNLKLEAEARSAAAERLVFAPFVTSAEDHLARLRLADLFLDTLPFNAHSTACDALWAGLPVITCVGRAFPGRVRPSVLKAVGLPELITHSLDEYEALALKLARDSAALTSLRAKRARNRTTHPLFDMKRFTRSLETAFVTMWEPHQHGLPAKSFAVS